jgi:hypothetical protein
VGLEGGPADASGVTSESISGRRSRTGGVRQRGHPLPAGRGPGRLAPRIVGWNPSDRGDTDLILDARITAGLGTWVTQVDPPLGPGFERRIQPVVAIPRVFQRLEQGVERRAGRARRGRVCDWRLVGVECENLRAGGGKAGAVLWPLVPVGWAATVMKSLKGRFGIAARWRRAAVFGSASLLAVSVTGSLPARAGVVGQSVAGAVPSALSGDFDGDGRSDIALAGAFGWTTLPVARTTASGMTVTKAWSPTFAAAAAKPGVKIVTGCWRDARRATTVARLAVSGRQSQRMPTLRMPCR